MSDSIKVTVLDDGSLKIETDKVSGPNHTSAELFLRELEKLAGVSADRKRKGSGVHHNHVHEPVKARG